MGGATERKGAEAELRSPITSDDVKHSPGSMAAFPALSHGWSWGWTQ